MNGKSDERIRMGGTIRIAGPDVLERLARGERVTIEDGRANELELEFVKGPALSLVKFDPLFWIDEADVSIHTDATDGDAVREDLTIYIDGKFDRSIGFNVSVDQAEVLGRILSNFIAAYKAKAELDKTWNVNA